MMDDSQTKVLEESEKQSKLLFILQVKTYEDGRRVLDVNTPDVEGQKMSPPIGVLRETVQWALNSVNDMIVGMTIARQLAALKDEKIVKPGWRPTKLLAKLAGR